MTLVHADDEEKLMWAPSWGATTRMSSAHIVTRSIDTGVVLPGRVTSIQVALVLILENEQHSQAVIAFADEEIERLRASDL